MKHDYTWYMNVGWIALVAAASAAQAGSVAPPHVGPIPTAAGQGVSTNTAGGSAVTNTPRFAT